jgi:hypothetical protein
MVVHPEIAHDKKNHDDDADNGEDVHLGAPIDRGPAANQP